MRLIVTEVYKALLSASAPEAKAVAGTIPLARDLASKEDIAELQAFTQQVIAESQATSQQDIVKLQQEIAKLQRDIAELRSSMAFMKFLYGPTVLALLFKLVFFP